MNRLTKDLNTPHDDTTYADIVKDCVDRENIVLTKLKHFEDIEEELGIDLLTLLRALMNGIYVIDDGYIEYDSIAGMEHWGDGVVWVETSCNQLMLFKDYGNTWALTEEELERKANES